MLSLTIEGAYQASIYILLFSTFISALELLSINKKYMEFVFPGLRMKNKKLKWLIMHYLQALLSVATFLSMVFQKNTLFHLFFVLLALLSLISYVKRSAGKDGADQLRILAFISYSVCFLLDNEMGKYFSVSFIAIQVLIAYATSGMAKILSKQWRGGHVLADILETNSYGIPRISIFLRRHRFIEKAASFSAIATMIAVPLSFIIPNELPILITLTMIFCFHLTTAVMMGLNDFVYTFPMAYPGIIILHRVLFL